MSVVPQVRAKTEPPAPFGKTAKSEEHRNPQKTKKKRNRSHLRRRQTFLSEAISIDRSMVAALLLTIPRQVPKSSTDDLAPARHAYRIGNTERGTLKTERSLDAPIRSGLVGRVVPPKGGIYAPPNVAQRRARSERYRCSD